MQDKTILLIVAIACVTVLDAIALVRGIDGTYLIVISNIIVGLATGGAAYAAGRRKGKVKDGDTGAPAG